MKTNMLTGDNEIFITGLYIEDLKKTLNAVKNGS